MPRRALAPLLVLPLLIAGACKQDASPIDEAPRAAPPAPAPTTKTPEELRRERRAAQVEILRDDYGVPHGGERQPIITFPDEIQTTGGEFVGKLLR